VPRLGKVATWVALLRGVNVGGHHKVPTAQLREFASGLGWAGVETYIASGNLIFDALGSRSDLTARLADGFSEQFGFAVPVVVVPADEVAQSAEDPPWPDDDPSRTAVAFFSAVPEPAALAAFEQSEWLPDELVVRGARAHLRYPDGLGRAKLTNDRLERVLGVTATTRNRRTVVKLAEICAARR
jgi:uncharacterized protein (DUF1697 family)